MKRSFPAFAFALMTTTVMGIGEAHADETSEAQSLFDDAKQLIQQGRWADACPRLARSNQLEPRPTTLFRLGECYENTARLASAWNAYLGSAAAATAAGETKRADYAKERAKRLEVMMPYVILTVNQQQAVIYRDGERVEETRWGTKIPIDAGEHVVVAEAPGKQRFTSKILIVEAGTTVVTVPPLLDTPSEVTPGPRRDPAPPPHARSTEARASTAPSGNDNAGLRRWSVILAGAGLASGGTGLALNLTGGDADSCKGACAAGTGLMVGGALLTAAGLAFFLASFGEPTQPARGSSARPFVFQF